MSGPPIRLPAMSGPPIMVDVPRTAGVVIFVAAGFGEFQPLDVAEGDESYRRNRRIELKLTER